MEILNILNVYPFILLTDFLRYVIVAGLGYLLFWVIFKHQWTHRIIQKKIPAARKMWFEFRYSLSTVVIFSLVGCGVYLSEQAGYTLIYEDISTYGWGYFFLSLVIMIVLHDAYFYWTHRLMHHPLIFRHVHLVHHRSTNPSPWAAYSFHPLEAIVEAGIVPLIVFTIPVHPATLSIFLIYMITRNVQGHLGIEFLPKWFINNRWLNWHTTTTHHDLHHKYFHFNYGLYFTWWDNWFGTSHPEYEETFEEVSSREKKKTSKKSSEMPHSNEIIAMLALLLSPVTVLGQSPEGLWTTFHEQSGLPRAQVLIRETPQGLKGEIRRIFLQPWEGRNPICAYCPGERQGRQIVGMTFLWDFEPDGDHYTGGKILDPANGEIYNSKMWLENDSLLKVRGYAGPFDLFYRTQSWKKQKDHPDGNPYTGIWQTIDDESGRVRSLVEIFAGKGRLAGKIRKIYLMPWEGEDPICQACTGEKKNAKIVGMEIMEGLKNTGARWSEGTVTDPGNGKTYRAALWLEDKSTLKVRGYLGPFFRTQTWRRAE